MALERNLIKALEGLLNMDVKGHALRERLQFSTEGRLLLANAESAINASVSARRTNGSWSEDERQVMREVFAAGYSSEAVVEACKRLSRDKSQVRAMAGNMKLRVPFASIR